MRDHRASRTTVALLAVLAAVATALASPSGGASEPVSLTGGTPTAAAAEGTPAILADLAADLVANMAHALRAPNPAAIAPVGLSPQDVVAAERFLQGIVVDVWQFWSETLAPFAIRTGVGVEWVAPAEYGSFSGCSVLGPTTARYCGSPIDEIAISDAFAVGIARAFGDGGTAIVVAHEYAHNVQDELGVLGSGVPVRTLELQADCLAGAWLASADRRGRLEPGDVEEAAAFLFWAGDDFVTSPQHHGTPEERVAALRLGYQSGTCSFAALP